ncbi:S-adenosyl-L-methionine-dependent methyltransferase [Piptocephalis cylindrospora]|uniref:type I protein arginine methyltransferase n=1 Tax=Piptocephalis cylindrospora TaxID=1907219 RepID=A0A4P9Y3B7_9FUNG|nr:S-adenosyl-L-methionine-dependent methyltransferase [Piptocephalis cylindrospora]|eukprot:RKP13122.1 S-adenosyl-L-methionine-dependent methyltransferase [Piptocephalis cylindrospora]
MTLKAKEGELARAQHQHEEYRQIVKEQFYDPLERSVPEPKAATSTGTAPQSDYYFTSYAHYEIHEQMLKDRVRTESYRDFMYENKNAFKDKVVLDVGCGTGILSMFAARSGARRVIAVDNSDIIHSARKIAKENGFDEEQLTFIRGKIEEIELPVQTVDIIISEWMGYFLLFEAMLDSVLTARDKYLAPGGFMAPSGSSIHLTLLEDEEYYNDRYTYWNDVYGFKMLTMRDPLFNEAGVDVVDGSGIISDSPSCLRDFDLNKVSSPELDFTAPFSIPVSRDARLHAFVGYFDIDFRGESSKPVDHPITFSTSANTTSTHWKQTILPLRNPLTLEAGDLVQGIFTCRKGIDNPRELDLTIDFWVTEADGETERVKRTGQTYQLR